MSRDFPYRKQIRLKYYDYSQHGAYFVTICTAFRQCFFGDVVVGEIRLNDAGKMVHQIWNEIPLKYSDVDLGTFVIMPNHLHGIVLVGARFIAPVHRPGNVHRFISDNQPHALEQYSNLSGCDVVDTGTYLGMNTNSGHVICTDGAGTGLGADTGSINRTPTQMGMGTMGEIVRGFKAKCAYLIHKQNKSFKWQRNYYERIIRNERELDSITTYIQNNPVNWSEDKNNPACW